MNWRSGIATIAVIALGVWVASSGAQGPAGHPRVAVCDLTRVFGKLQMASDLEQKFGGKKTQIEGEAVRRRELIGKLQQELEAFSPGTADYLERRKRMLEATVQAEVWIREQEIGLREKHKNWFEKVYRLVTMEVQKLANQGGIDVVLADNPIEFGVPDVDGLIAQIRQKNVIYASPSPNIDLTEDVIKGVDAAYELAGGAAQIKVDN